MMQFKLVSWNVRGLNNRDKRRVIKNIMGDWKADIICLQETKFITELVRQIWGDRWVKMACLEASGTRGGAMMLSLCTQLLCGKKTNMLQKRNIVLGEQEFSDLIEDLNLIDLQLENAKFTWFKGDNHQIASRIDKILVSQ
ncbi:hypothetical protein MTR67_003166 [Solanum verrucosum]|uniref:Endonuclease/exonuclease/phosphatase domain-containing protein n=1 Tax=Solanum verrucosum TaxID=315347 RepID=A0AAF0PS74_SOLVR|nr:hypothetical protein MTR67_003166 [Solanum verrucosum]